MPRHESVAFTLISLVFGVVACIAIAGLVLILAWWVCTLIGDIQNGQEEEQAWLADETVTLETDSE